jgi:tRNA (guanine26-N2/guanine27-N2)-dimethyltransferase
MYKIITEGGTQLYVPVLGSFGKRASGVDRKPPVFYNPHMELNRDLTVLFMQVAGGDLVFADVLAGSGAKGIRVAVESGCKIFLNDANPDATELIKKNAELNRVGASISNTDANRFALENIGAFDFIDIDPFGSPVPFLDSALLSVKKDGFIGATATDTATLCGIYSDTCFRRYQARPLRSEFCHEVGLRILIGFLARTAAKYDKGIQPILSHSTRHYFRVYPKTVEGVRAAKDSLDSLGFLYFCEKCRDFKSEKSAFPSERHCNCGGAMKTSGPLWLGSLKVQTFLEQMLSLSQYKDEQKLLGLLSAEIDEPFYFDVHRLAKTIRVSPVGIEKIIERLREGGFSASRTHFTPVGVKTDAPIDLVKSVLS